MLTRVRDVLDLAVVGAPRSRRTIKGVPDGRPLTVSRGFAGPIKSVWLSYFSQRLSALQTFDEVPDFWPKGLRTLNGVPKLTVLLWP